MLEIQTAAEQRQLAHLRLARLEGILAVLAPLIFLIIPIHPGSSDSSVREIIFCLLSVVPLLILPNIPVKRASLSAFLISLSFVFYGVASASVLFEHQVLFLGSALTVISAFFVLTDAFRAEKDGTKRISKTPESAFWATALLPMVFFIAMLNRSGDETARILAVVSASSVTVNAVLSGLKRSSPVRHISVLFGSILLLAAIYAFFDFYMVSVILFFGSIAGLAVLNFHSASPIHRERWYDFLLDHPARNLMVTFLILSIVGTILLSLPISAGRGQISLIDAAFTSVSAVCVTGLAVLDTPNDFSPVGQALLLLLIQVGGLGIMSIATVGIHAAGKRLSLKRERAMLSLMNTTHNDLLQSLSLILKFTFITEAVGAVLLTIFFSAAGESFPSALWNGIFTAVSGFCNAGFALFSDNLVSFQTNPFILITVSFLIILGGISPAVCIMIPRLIQKKERSEFASMVLIATGILLFAGTASMLIIEWNGVLGHLSVPDKFWNAWFQSVTFRTAGFNSVSIGDFANTTLLITIVLMFIGGSPGGTAGGIKTTTASVLFLSFWNNILGNPSVSLKNRVIPQSTINRAVTIFFSALFLLGAGIVLLELTQNLPVRDLIFEAASALGTVGLSTGITAKLDEAGKLIIMFLMYAGRIGPITLFMLFTNDTEQSELEKPEAQIAL